MMIELAYLDPYNFYALGRELIRICFGHSSGYEEPDYCSGNGSCGMRWRPSW